MRLRPALRELEPVLGCVVTCERHDRQGAEGNIVRGQRWSMLLCTVRRARAESKDRESSMSISDGRL